MKVAEKPLFNLRIIGDTLQIGCCTTKSKCGKECPTVLVWKKFAKIHKKRFECYTKVDNTLEKRFECDYTEPTVLDKVPNQVLDKVPNQVLMMFV